jgi:hypothetical protein
MIVHFDITSTPHIHRRFDLVENLFFFLELMVSRMATSYEPQVTQANEKPALESSLDLTLTQYPCDQKLELRKVRACLEVDPTGTWYYRISLNSRTLVILLQVDLISGDEPKTIYEGYYETKDTSIFAWSLIPNVGHYCWLCGSIRRLPLNNKADYLVRTIQHILDFL